MIGNVVTGKSFFHCISYCLEDKKNLSDEEKIQRSAEENVQHKDRAEILHYNNCFGNVIELTNQFSEVRQLNRRVEKPVLHISLRLAPGETLPQNQLIEIGQACAEAFKVDQNQYLCILHKDTRDQHIHIVANRVGYDGKVASDSNSYLRMANLCRKLEKEYRLQQVLNPRVFLSKEERLIPRHDSRKEKLKEHIAQTLKQVNNYDQFEQKMKSLGYQVLKSRGIAFIDDKKVKVKGSEVGFSLMQIDRILALKQEQKINQIKAEKTAGPLQKEKESEGSDQPANAVHKTIEKAPVKEKETPLFENDKSNLLEELMKPEQMPDNVLPEFLKKRRRKKLKHRPGL